MIEGEPRYSTENHVGDFPVIMPAMDVTSIGAGGGSIAWIDAMACSRSAPERRRRPGPGLLRPRRREPTLTDAFVCLGIVDPKRLSRRHHRIDPGRAEHAVAGSAVALGSTCPTAPRASCGSPPRRCTRPWCRSSRARASATTISPCCRSAGPGRRTGFLLAREVGIRRVIVPPIPACCARRASLVADIRRDFVRTLHMALQPGAGASVLTAMREALRRARGDGRGLARRAGPRVSWSRRVTLVRRHPLSRPVLRALRCRSAPDVLAEAIGSALRSAFQTKFSSRSTAMPDAASLDVLMCGDAVG